MNLDAWLDTIENLHRSEIELGLDRVSEVAGRMEIDRLASKIVTVAGTNGKGSCVAILETIALAHGLRVGSYTSPHIHRYNERVKLQGKAVEDEQLCQAFQQVEDNRDSTSLTYFEFGTLAAFWLFSQVELDLVVLEVGLGGRLDAVNIIDPDIAVITSIAIDHSSWLGENVEEIGYEKAGIIRNGIPVICVDENPPVSVLQRAEELTASVYRSNQDYGFKVEDSHWNWWGSSSNGNRVEITNLPPVKLTGAHTAAAIQTLQLLGVALEFNALAKAVTEVFLPGRFELITDDANGCQVLLDVAHNPAAASLLGQRLTGLRQAGGREGKIIAVLAMMADKDIKGFYQALKLSVDRWHFSQLDYRRSMPAKQLAKCLAGLVDGHSFCVFEDIETAYQEACKLAEPHDLILVTGSFMTVAAVRTKLVIN